MRWPASWPQTFLTLLLVALEYLGWSESIAVAGSASNQWTAQRKLNAREKTRDLWYHGFSNYMQHAFPMDELAPLSCTGRGPDWYNPANIAANDVAGNFSVTLVDVLDTFVILNDTRGFEKAVRDVIQWVSFDVNTKPQVFETTIRVLGGLLSAHQFANQTEQAFHLPWYRGELLTLAHDLGNRLLPAFHTQTGLPYARLNLRHGVPKGESIDTCTAGAGSLILEFGTLSRLTGDPRFEKAAYKAFFALWNRKSDIGLVGNTINAWSGNWLHPEISNVGAGIDSFYEYALKWYILSGEVEFLDVWQESYAAVMRYSRAPDGFWYRSANIYTGDVAYYTFDSLSAFWPGLQVLAGDVDNAIKSHQIYWNLWQQFSGLPEVWDMNYKQATSTQYPLRPEFVESTWYLYRATRDPFYLDVAERILRDLTRRAKVDCGLTGIGDLKTNQRDDRMESFVLSETLKYLYLLFDEHNPLHNDDSNYVLTTEGHILSLDRSRQKPLSAIRRKLRGVEHLQCPAYRSNLVGFDTVSRTGLTSGVRSRNDVEYARYLVGTIPGSLEELSWSRSGRCEVPLSDLYSYNVVLSVGGQAVPEDPHPSIDKLTPSPDGYVIQNVTGIRTHVVSRLDGNGYDITKLGPYAVKTGQMVYINDTELFADSSGKKSPNSEARRRSRTPEVDLRIFMDYADPKFQQQQPGLFDGISETLVVALTAMFGGDPTLAHVDGEPLRFGHGNGVRLVRDPSNTHGCKPFDQTYDGEALVVLRGECTFLEKLAYGKAAGASGVIAISNEDKGVNPSADVKDLQAVGDPVDDVVIVVVSRSDGATITSLLDTAETFGAHVMLAIATSGHPDAEDEYSKDGASTDSYRVLYLNGHPLQNTRLLV